MELSADGADWTDWPGRREGKPPPLPANLRRAAQVFAALDSIRGWLPGGMGPSLPQSIDESRIVARGEALGLRGSRLALLIDQVTLFEHFWRAFAIAKINEELNR